MQLLAVCIGAPQPTTAKSGTTGYFKKPQSGTVAIAPDGLAGDFIGDLDHHGGKEQAVYLFSQEDADWWADELGHPCPPGHFGENLRIAGFESASLCLGDMITIGDVVLQITSPRIPCATYAAQNGGPAALKAFFAAARPGAYARVLTSGDVRAGQTARLVPFDGEKITIGENLAATQSGFTPDFLRRALAVPAHVEMHQIAHRKLGLAE